MMTSRMCFAKTAVSMVAFWLIVASVAAQPAQAQKFKVLHTFHGTNGALSWSVLVRDAAGNLYGTTIAGGRSKCNPPYGCGTAFKLNKNGKQIWVHTFERSGLSPHAGLLRDATGNLYGTALHGGDTTCNPPYGCGTVFKLNSKSGKETVLYKFTGNPDGNFPETLLVNDKAGNLYGTTYSGGGSGDGTVFKVTKTGKETVLYSFTGGADGCAPYPGVTLDSAGNLYGVARQGGDGDCSSGNGVVFEVDTSGKEMVLHTFSGGLDGANPDSVLLFDSSGNLYGTTEKGGNAECAGMGCGVVFKLSPQAAGSWAETVLYAFCSITNCADGNMPVTGPLVKDSAGNLYGTTYSGGTHLAGVIFKLDPSGKETVLHNFTSGSDGWYPVAGLTMDSDHRLYGTTMEGGTLCYSYYSCGVVFKITP